MTKSLQFIVTLLVVSIFLVSPAQSRADCLACWSLFKVKVHLKNGGTKTGFVFWNEAWLYDKVENWKELENKFPENFLAYHRSKPKSKEIRLLKRVIGVKNDSLGFEFKAITQEDKLTIPLDEIKGMEELDKNAERYGGAGDIPVFTQFEINKLNTNPSAIYSVNIHVADVYFLSYNKAMTKSKLKEIGENWDLRAKELEPSLIAQGVIIVTLSYD